MKKLLYTILLIVSAAGFLSGQSVSGVVKDENGQNIVFATVSLVSMDSAIVAYTVTDNKGDYKLNAPEAGNYILQAQSLGFTIKTKNISLQRNEKLTQTDIILEEDILFLGEVEVKSRATGIQYKEDTIRYDPKMFIDGSEVLLGDVLDKLPGVEVKKDGTIKAHGKDVEKVLLDGQDFFQGNTQMAVNNLPADIAEKVEVLNNYSEYSLLDGFKSHEQTVINVGVNKEKFGKISGNLSAGGAIKDKYYAKGNIMQIQPKYMMSFIGALNNTGEQVFSIMDYLSMQGGINELISDVENSGIGITEEEIRMLMPKNNTYSNVNGLSALNLAWQPKAELKVNSYVLFNKNKTMSEDLNRFTYDLPFQNRFISEQRSSSVAKNDMVSGYLKLNYKPDPDLNIIYSGLFSNSVMNENINSFNSMGNENLSVFARDNIRSLNTKHKAVLMRSIKKHLLMANVSFEYSNKPSYYDFNTDSLLLPLSISPYEGRYYLRQNKTSEAMSGNLSLSFLYKISSKYFAKISVNGNLDRKNYNTRLMQSSPVSITEDFENDSLKNDIRLHSNNLMARISFTKNKGLFRFNLGTSANYYSYGNGITDILEKNKFKMTSNVELALYFSDKHFLKTSFTESLSQNPINIFTSGIVLDNFMTYSQNNMMNYLYNKSYNIDMTYSIFDVFSNTMLLLYGGFMKTENKNTYDYYQNGMLTKYFSVLAPPDENMYVNMNFNKGLGFIPWDISLNANYSHGSYISKISGIDNKVLMNNTGVNLQITSRYKKFFNINLMAGMDYVKNNPSLGEVSRQRIGRYGGKLNFNISKKLYSYVELEYIVNRSIERTTELYNLNASIRYSFTKNFELELIGRNMLNLRRQEWSVVTYTANYTLEHYFRQIPGNIMLKLNWRF